MRYKRKKSYWQQDIRRKDYIVGALKGLLLIITISYLFYGSILSAILLSPYLIWYLKSWEKECIKKKKQALGLQFKEAIQALSTALNVGYSLENAMKETMKDLQLIYKKDELILREFRYMLHQLEMNLPVERVLNEFAFRTEVEDVHTFVTVFGMAKRSGGDMIGIIGNAVRQISEKIEVKREIETILSAKRLEFKVMSVVPLAMIAYMKISFPDFMNVLYGNATGYVIMTVCLGIYVISYVAGKRMIEIEV